MLFLIYLFLIISNFLPVTSQWGYNNWNIPNNNLAIGYPTAYGLYAGRGHNGWGNENGNHPSSGTGFGSPLRCLNGGAHIGQCRLDKDSICIALGGTCTHGACCTTPFVSLGLKGGSSTVSPEKNVIDGEATERTKKKITRKLRRTTTTTMRPDSEGDEDEDEDIIKSAELEEWNKLIEHARTSPSPLETSTSPMTVTPFTETPEPRTCESGLRPVGPCSDDSDCPTLHQCENQQCCYLLLGVKYN